MLCIICDLLQKAFCLRLIPVPVKTLIIIANNRLRTSKIAPDSNTIFVDSLIFFVFLPCFI